MDSQLRVVGTLLATLDEQNVNVWDPTCNLGRMTYDMETEEMVAVFPHVPCGEYEFKITSNGCWEGAIGADGRCDGAAPNMILTVPLTSRVSIFFNPASGHVTSESVPHMMTDIDEMDEGNSSMVVHHGAPEDYDCSFTFGNYSATEIDVDEVPSGPIFQIASAVSQSAVVTGVQTVVRNAIRRISSSYSHAAITQGVGLARAASMQSVLADITTASVATLQLTPEEGVETPADGGAGWGMTGEVEELLCEEDDEEVVVDARSPPAVTTSQPTKTTTAASPAPPAVPEPVVPRETCCLSIIKSLIKPVEKLIGGGQTAAITGTATA